MGIWGLGKMGSIGSRLFPCVTGEKFKQLKKTVTRKKLWKCRKAGGEKGRKINPLLAVVGNSCLVLR